MQFVHPQQIARAQVRDASRHEGGPYLKTVPHEPLGLDEGCHGGTYGASSEGGNSAAQEAGGDLSPIDVAKAVA
jgi:hypothetical protein